MTGLHQALATWVASWRDAGYRHDRFPAIAEILGFAMEDEDRQHLYFTAAAIRKLAALDPDRIVYRMVFADQIVPAADVTAIGDFLSAPSS